MKRYFLCALLAAFLCACAFSFGEEAPHAHDWSDYAVTLEPTCTHTGTEVRICKICGASEIETLAMIDHDYGNWQYYSDDQHVRYCSVCGASELQSHDSAIAKTVTAPADNRLGKKSITCAGCGYNYTRLVSVYDRLYTQEGTDVLGNGTAYLKVNTLSLQKDSEKQLTLYSDGVFDLYAVSNCTVELYASADSGEFRGLKLASGSAVLRVSGGRADLDFITLSGDAAMQIEFRDDQGSLCLSSSDAELIYLDAAALDDGNARLNVVTSLLDGHQLNMELNSYLAPAAVFSFADEHYSGYDAQLIQNAQWQYNTRSGVLSAKATSGRLMVMSGSSVLLNGAASGTLDKSDMPWGWYCLYTASDETLAITTPTYTFDGHITSAPENRTASQDAASDANAQDDPANTGSEESDEGQTALSFSSPYSEKLSASPDIDISYSEGVYSVKVGSVPTGFTLTRIEFIQTFSGGFRLKNAYGAEAAFAVENYSGRLSATAVFTDSKGNEKRVPAGEYEFKAN